MPMGVPLSFTVLILWLLVSLVAATAMGSFLADAGDDGD